MIETVWFGEREYPSFQTNGNAARFCLPFAQEVCKGLGYDIGCNRPEWAFPNSIPIDIALNEGVYDAMNLPEMQVDYIHSSHCLEHIKENYSDVLAYWATKIRSGGVLFLYLPDYSQEYWRPWHNKKHIHVFTPEIIHDCLQSLGVFYKIFVSGVDAYNSFTAFAERI